MMQIELDATDQSRLGDAVRADYLRRVQDLDDARAYSASESARAAILERMGWDLDFLERLGQPMAR